MSLFLRENPFFESTRSLLNNSILDDFNDDHLLHSVIPRSSSRKAAISRPRYFFHHHHRASPYKTLERQLRKELLRDRDVFKLVDFSPKINVSEDDDHYYIHADLPGMTKDQVKMEISEDRFFILSGERKSVTTKKTGGCPPQDSEAKIKSEKKTIEKKGKKNKSSKKSKSAVKKQSPEEEKEEEEASKVVAATSSNDASEVENPHQKFSLMECHYGKFKRSFNIPENVDLDHIRAKMENGVLKVTFNKLVSDQKKNPVRTIHIN